MPNSSQAASGRRTTLILLLGLAFLAAQLMPLSLPAQAAPGTTAPVNPASASSTAMSGSSSLRSLDLSSTERTVTAAKSGIIVVGGQLSGGHVLGGTPQNITQGSLLTPAQNAALWQSVQGSGQLLLLNSTGAAVGGSANLKSSWAGNLSSLVVPSGVQINALNFNSGHPLNVAGAASILGSVYALQSTPGVTAILNFAQNLNIGSGGVVSGYLPAGLAGLNLPGASTLFASANMNLNVARNFNNQGIVTVPGTLNLNVGGTLTNGLAAASAASIIAQNINIVSGSGNIFNTGLMQALNTFNISSTGTALNINNTGGVLSAASGDMAISALTSPLSPVNNLSIINTGGTIEAQAGAIRLSTGPDISPVNNAFAAADTHACGDIRLNGGDLLSQALNFYAPNGAVEVSVQQVSGVVDVTACQAHIGAATPDLRLGNLNVSGDPTYYNTAGSLSVNNIASTSGQDLALLASQDVIVSSGALDTRAVSGNGGSITIVAGANLTSTGPAYALNDTTSTLTVLGASTTGGSVDLTGVTQVNTAGTGASSNGGNIQMVAYSGSGAGSTYVPGAINTDTASLNSAGTGAGKNGNITVYAGAITNPLSGSSVIINGPITASGGSGGGGALTISTVTPTLPGGAVSILNGTVNAGSFGQGALQTASIALGASASSAGMTLSAGNAVTIANGVTLTTSAGSISTPTLNLGSGSTISSSTSISVSAPGTSALTVVAPTGSLATLSAPSLGVSFTSSAGKDLTFAQSAAGSATLAVSGPLVTTTSSAGTTRINSGVTLAGDNSLTLNVNSGTLNVNGSLTTSAAAGSIVIQSSGSLAFTGTPSAISVTGGGAAGITLSVSGSNALTLPSSYVLNAGAAGAVFVKALSGSINAPASGTFVTGGGSALLLLTPTLNLGAGSRIQSYSIYVDTGNVLSPYLYLYSPGGSSATLAATGGNISITAPNTIVLQQSGAGTTVLNANTGGSGTVNILSTLNMSGAVTLSSDSNINTFGSVAPGIISSSKNGGTITMQNCINLGSGTIQFNSPASGNIVISAPFAIWQKPYFDPGSTGSVSITVTSYLATGGGGLDISIGSGAPLTFNVGQLSLSDGDKIRATGPSTISISTPQFQTQAKTTATMYFSVAAGGQFQISNASGTNFSQYYSAGIPTFDFSGGNVTISGKASVTSNTTIRSDSLITFDTDSSTLTNNGTIASTLSGPANTIIISSSGTTMSMSGTGTISQMAAAPGGTLFQTPSGGTIRFTDSTAQTITGGGAVTFQSSTLSLGNAVFLNATGDSPILVTSNAPNDNLNIFFNSAPAVNSQIQTGAAGTITISPSGAGTLHFGFSGVSTAGSLYLYTAGGTGQVNISASSIIKDPGFNVYSNSSMFISSSPASGSGTSFNIGGDLFLAGDIITTGANLALIAAGNITLSGAGTYSISTASGIGNGGNILIVAGAGLSSAGAATGAGDALTNVYITGRSASGGSILFDNGSASVGTIDSRATSGNFSGGNITLLAYGGTAVDSGRILLPSTSTILSGGYGAGRNGNVTIYIGNLGSSPSTLGSINTTGGSGGSGTISISNQNNPLPASIPGYIRVLNGNVISGSFTGNGSVYSSPLTTGNLTAAGAIGIANTYASFTAGDISGKGIDMSATTATLGNLNGGGTGMIYLRVSSITSGDITNDGVNGDAGVIQILAGSLSSGNISANGTNNGKGGTINIQASPFFCGSVNANGAGSGVAGTIGINSSFTGSTFYIGNATVQGTRGPVSALGSTNGSISIANRAGPMVIGYATVTGGDVTVASYDAGGITVFNQGFPALSASGTLSITAPILSFQAGSSVQAAGKVDINQSPFYAGTAAGNLTISGTGTITGTAAGASIYIGPKPTWLSTDTLTISGNITLTPGAGGNVYFQDTATSGLNLYFASGSSLNITTAGAGLDISTNLVAGLNVYAPSGGNASITTNGGTALIGTSVAGKNLVFLPTSTPTGTITFVNTPVTTSSTGYTTISALVSLSSNSDWLSTSAGNITVTGSITANNITLRTTGGTGNSLSIGGAVNASNLAALSVAGSDSIVSSGGVISANLINMSSGTGSIGSLANKIQTSTSGTVTITVSAGGDAYISNISGTPTLGISSAAGTFYFLDNTSLNLTNNISAPTVKLATTTASNGDINIGINLSATSALFLSAGGSGSITQSAGVTFSSPLVNLSTETGTASTSAKPLATATNLIIANSGTDVYVSQSGAVNIGPSSATNTFKIVGNSSITMANPLSADNIQIVTAPASGGNIVVNANLTAGTGVSLLADGSVSTGGSGGTTGAPTVTLVATNGSIGATGQSITVNSANLSAQAPLGNVYVTDTAAGSIILSASSAGNGKNFNLITASGSLNISGNIAAATGTISALTLSALSLTVSAVITGANVVIHTNSLTDNGTITSPAVSGTIAIDNTGYAGALTLAGTPNPITVTGAGTDCSITVTDYNSAGLNLNTSYTFNAGVGLRSSVTLSSPGGAVSLAGGTILTLSAQSANITAPVVNIGTTGNAATLQDSASSIKLTLNTSVLNNYGTITSPAVGAQIYITNQGRGGDLTLAGSSGRITCTDAGLNYIYVRDYTGSLNISSSCSFDAGGSATIGNTTFLESLHSGGTVNIGSAVIVSNSTSNLFIRTNNFIDNGTVTTSASNIGFDNFGLGGGMTFSGSPNPVSVTSAAPSQISFADYTAGGISFNSSYAFNTGNASGSDVVVQSSLPDAGGSINIAPGVTLSSSAPTLLLRTSTLNDNGTITGQLIQIDNGGIGGALTLAGTPSTITAGSCVVQNSYASQPININSSYDFDAAGLAISASASGGSVILSDNVSLTTHNTLVWVQAPSLTFGASSAISESGNRAITINANGALGTLTITAPTGSAATVSTLGGAVNISQAAGQAIAFVQSGTGTSTLNLNGGPVSIGTSGTGGTVTVASGITLSSNNNVAINAGDSVAVNGNMQCAACSITVAGAANITGTGFINGTTSIALTSGSGAIGPFTLTTPTLAANTTGNVTLTDIAAANIDLQTSSGALFTLNSSDAAGGITISGTLSATAVNLNAGSVGITTGVAASTTASSLTITSTGTVIINDSNAGPTTLNTSYAGSDLNSSFNLQTEGSLQVLTGSTVSAGSLNFASNARSISITGTLNAQAGGIGLTANAGLANFGNPALVTATNNITVSASTVTIGTEGSGGATLTAGVLADAPDTGPLSPTQIASAGALTIYSAEGITVNSRFSGGTASRLTANGGDISLASTEGSITLTSSTQGEGGLAMQANGGNIVILANGPVNGFGQGNSFVARSVGSAASFSGGGIEIGSGPNIEPSITNYFATRTNAFIVPPQGSIGSNVTINNITSPAASGAVIASGTGINVSYCGKPTTINVSSGVLIFETTGEGNINLDPDFTVYSFGLPLPVVVPTKEIVPPPAIEVPVISVIIPPDSTTVQTDKLPPRTVPVYEAVGAKQKTQVLDLSAQDNAEGNEGPFFVASRCLPFALRNDRETLIVGDNNSVLAAVQRKNAADGQKDLALKEGRIAVLTWQERTTVETEQGLVFVAPEGIVIVEQRPSRTVKVTNLSGPAVAMQTGAKETYTVAAGERLSIADAGTEEEEEDLIPADAANDVVVHAKITINSGRQIGRQTKFDASRFWEKEPLLLCEAAIEFKHKYMKEIASAQPARKTSHAWPFTPIAFQKPVLNVSAGSLAGVQMLESEGLKVRFLEPTMTTLLKGGVLRLRNGEVCIETSKTATVLIGTQRLKLDADSVVLVNKQDDLLCVRNLSDRKRGAVRINAGKYEIPVLMGQQAVISARKRTSARSSILPPRFDSVGIRRTRLMNLADGNKVASSEVSLMGLLCKDSLLAALRKSNRADDRNLFNKSMKAAVSLNYATGSHGAYSEE